MLAWVEAPWRVAIATSAFSSAWRGTAKVLQITAPVYAARCFSTTWWLRYCAYQLELVSYSRCFMRLRKINDGWTKMDQSRSHLALSFVDGAYKQKKIDTCHTLLCTYNTIWLVDCILDWCLSSVKVLRNCALVVFYVLSDNHHFNVVRSKRSENINYIPKLAQHVFYHTYLYYQYMCCFALSMPSFNQQMIWKF